MTCPLPGKSLSSLISYSSVKAQFKCLGDASSDTPWAMSYLLPCAPRCPTAQVRTAITCNVLAGLWSLSRRPGVLEGSVLNASQAPGQCLAERRLQAKGQVGPGYDPTPSPLATAPSCSAAPEPCPPRPGLQVGLPRLARGRRGRVGVGERHQPRPRGRSEQETAGRGPAPGPSRTCLTLAGNLLQG